MQLHFKKTGEGKDIIILHGLFGSGDNWATFGRRLSESGFAVYLADLRNHGHSPWDAEHTYQSMSDDLQELITSNKLINPVVIGHSMGGKAAMRFTLDHSDMLCALIVIDIAPRYYAQHHQQILQGLLAVDTGKISSRQQADEQLKLYIKDNSTRQLLLKNLFWKENGKLAWRFNLNTLNAEIENVGVEIEGKPVTVPALFVKGEKSDYIKEEDLPSIKNIFPAARLITIKEAGHWIHADKPDSLLDVVVQFLNECRC